MIKHRNRGSLVAMAAGLVMVLLLIGSLIYAVISAIGGEKQLINATDAGLLNVGKTVSNEMGVPLNAGTEASHFSYYVSNTGPKRGTMGLVEYNRAIGQALMAASNAQGENTQEAYNNVRNLINSLQGSPQSLGGRLETLLSQYQEADQNGHAIGSAFLGAANANPLQLIGMRASARINAFQKAYYAQETCNFSIDGRRFPNLRPYLDVSGNNRNYNPLAPHTTFVNAGYRSIPFTINGQRLSIMGVPLNPRKAAFLGSSLTFNAGLQSPLNSTEGRSIPPNAFSIDTSGQNGERGLAGSDREPVVAAVLNALNSNAYPAAIPNGYMKIINPPGVFVSTTAYKDAQASSNYQLIPGLFTGMPAKVISAAEDGGTAYDRGRQRIQAWITWNHSDPRYRGAPPSLVDIFNSQGEQATFADGVRILSFGRFTTYMNKDEPDRTGQTYSWTGAAAKAYGIAQNIRDLVLRSDRMFTAEEIATRMVFLAYVEASHRVEAGEPEGEFTVRGSDIPTTCILNYDYNRAQVLNPYANGGHNRGDSWRAAENAVVNQHIYYGGLAPFTSLCYQIDDNLPFARPPGFTYPSAFTLWAMAGKALRRRMEQIDPLITDAQFARFAGALGPLGTVLLEPGAGATSDAAGGYYIYQLHDGSNQINHYPNDPVDRFVVSKDPPPWVGASAARVQPDCGGITNINPQTPQAVDPDQPFSLIGMADHVDTTINPPSQNGMHDRLFSLERGNLMVNFRVDWQPSSGAGTTNPTISRTMAPVGLTTGAKGAPNFLGQFVFTNYLTGEEVFSKSN